MSATLTTGTTCPPWCTLTPGHDWDSIIPETGVEVRGHGGPTFGKFLSAFGEETSAAPGFVGVGISLHADEYDINDLGAAMLLDLAADAVSVALGPDRSGPRCNETSYEHPRGRYSPT